MHNGKSIRPRFLYVPRSIRMLSMHKWPSAQVETNNVNVWVCLNEIKKRITSIVILENQYLLLFIPFLFEFTHSDFHPIFVVLH